MSESWRKEIPVRQVTETVAKIEAEIAESVENDWIEVDYKKYVGVNQQPLDPPPHIYERRPHSSSRLPITKPLSDIEVDALVAAAKVLAERPIGNPKGEGYTWHDRCPIRSDNKLRCVYVKDHDYPCKFDIGTGG